LNTALIAAIVARSASEKIHGMKSRFSSPMPCSPEIVPPASTHARMISAPAASTRASSPGLRGS
jgi:hypothetical protein